MLLAPSPSCPIPAEAKTESKPTVNELLVTYWDRHVTTFDVKDGRTTSAKPFAFSGGSLGTLLRRPSVPMPSRWSGMPSFRRDAAAR